MPYIFNALNTKVTTVAHGNGFTWKPLEIKMIHNKNLADFLSQNRAEDGLVEIYESTMELEKSSPEYKEIIEEKRKQGVQNRVAKLESLKRNLLVSLRTDVEIAGIKADPLAFASKGELQNLKELAALQDQVKQNELNTADEIRKVLGEIDGSGSSTNVGTNNQGHTSPPQPAKSGK